MVDLNDVQPGEQSLPFDPRSGSLPERVLFNNRPWVVAICLVLTVMLGWQSTRLRLNASFEKTIPTEHAFIVNYLAYKSELTGLGNALRISVANDSGDIFDASYLETLRRLNDEIFFLPWVDRTYLKSLWTPSTRWVGVTEEGLEGGPVIPEHFDGSKQSLEQLRRNIARSGEIGQLVAFNMRSSIIYVPLLAVNSEGRPLDYTRLSGELETLRATYQKAGVHIHITGFAKVIGDMIDGLFEMAQFFCAAVLIATVLLFAYTRCARSTLLVVLCSLTAVLWQLGLLPVLGFELDPYSVLVPFLVFAIGMSHGAQKMNGVIQDVGRGMHRLVAARMTFRRLFFAGLSALLCDAVGFAVLVIIRIRTIQDLALIAAVGVAVLIFTNLILLPILLSYLGVSPAAARRSAAAAAPCGGSRRSAIWRLFGRFTGRYWAVHALAAATVLAVLGLATASQLRIGDLDPGAPELRPESRYNRDNAFMVSHYGASSDVFAVLVKTPEGECADYDALMRLDALEWELAQTQGVDSTNSIALLNRRVLTGLNEGNPKWYELLHSQPMLNMITGGAPRGLYNESCNLLTLYAYLTDHRADTLTRVVDRVQRFAARNDRPGARFLLAAGNAGIEAATNIVVHQANGQMLVWVYGSVFLLCLVTFRSWRAVLCALVPLALTSILCEALMVCLSIGVKVATLPVIALGVGIGVDYALYVMSIMLARLRRGVALETAYGEALEFTGRVVMFTGLTLALAVGTWAFSPIKFQADMGVLLAFMFLLNMLGAMILVPALAHFVLGTRATRGSEPLAAALPTDVAKQIA
jgi:predicted RND superfamily exporter protein